MSKVSWREPEMWRGASWRLARPMAASLALACLMAACGGGDGKGGDVLGAPEPAVLAGPACADCRPGHVSGVASTGEALADAQVRAFDAGGRIATGRTDASGRFHVDVRTLEGPVLLQIVGMEGGRAVALHALAHAHEVGQRFFQVTPLTELIAARVLGGIPSDLAIQGRMDPLRASAPALAEAARHTEAIVRPLLDWAGASGVDLRLGPAAPEGAGLNKVLGALVVEARGEEGHSLRALWQAPGQAALISPDGGEVQSVAAPDASQQAVLAGGRQVLALIRAQLDAMSALFADGLPDPVSLRAWLRDDFHHAGLGRDEHIAQVLLRQDPAQHGGFSLAGARFDDVRLVEVADATRLRVRWRVRPRAPFEAFDVTMWLVREGQAWRWQGDGGHARLRIRHASVLTARAMGEADVRALPGVLCGQGGQGGALCLAEGGAQGVPEGGFLDYGLAGQPPGQTHVLDYFGLLAFYRSQADTAQARLSAHAAHSRFVGEASAEVLPYVLFELDARQSDPRAVRAVVQGPGLPAAGLSLRRPARTAGRPDADHWAWPSDETQALAAEDWQGVPAQWCQAVAAGAHAMSCERAWAGLGAGSRYTVSLHDEDDRVLGQAEAFAPALPGVMRPRRADAELLSRFALWRLAPGQHLSLAWLLGGVSPASGDALAFDAPWQPPTAPGHRLMAAELTWHRAGFPPSFGQDIHRQRSVWPADDAAEVWRVSAAARPGFRSTWLALRLTSSDVHGNRFIHAVSPGNPW